MSERGRWYTLSLGALMDAPDVETYARRLLRARVKLGSATRSERLRYWLRLNPPRWMFDAAVAIFKARELREQGKR